MGRVCALRALYDAIYRIKMDERDYISQHTADKIAPALAQLCGYTEPCHFSRGFSARVGMTPREFAAHAKKDM